MDVFQLRDSVIDEYRHFVESFVHIRDDRIRRAVKESLSQGVLWPDPWISLNPSFAIGGTIEDLVAHGILHAECANVFRLGKEEEPKGIGRSLSLYRHQVEAIEAARAGDNYVLTTGTGSGKSLAYIVPIVDRIIREGSGGGIKAIIVYPMNALANSQEEELGKFLAAGYPDGRGPVTFRRYTGQESDDERRAIIADPPDILLTNYVMLELILTRFDESQLLEQARGLRFLVLDELHTYRGRQGSDVALLTRRVREACDAEHLQYIGTSATLASAGSLQEQREEIAKVATRLFGTTVRPERVIGETLERTTESLETAPNFSVQLRKAILDETAFQLASPEDLARHPLLAWLEATIGVRELDGELVRAEPRTLLGPDGLAARLAALSGTNEAVAAAALRRALLAAHKVRNRVTGQPLFAFKLHQFVSRGSGVYATIEPESTRVVALTEQRYAPGDRSKRLFPLAFCRDGGQEYYVVEWVSDDQGSRLIPRDLGDTNDEKGRRRLGFLYASTTDPWPDDEAEQLDRLPTEWLEEDGAGRPRLRNADATKVPQPLWVAPDGTVHEEPVEGALRAWWVPAPFRFCLWSGATYAATLRSDFTKLATIGFEGRATATTMLSVGILRFLERDGHDVARKLLYFTDNRQDAALQAGHFNDFVQVSALRAALYQAVERAGEEGLDYIELPRRVQEALGLSPEEYAQNPLARYGARDEIDRALREVLAYRLYADLRAGWRITAPNLEQVGLLRVDYADLEELCADEAQWAQRHEVLAAAKPKLRAEVARALLDHLRQNLVIKVDQLDSDHHETLYARSNQHLIAPWAIDESERDHLVTSQVALLGPRSGRESIPAVRLSPRSLVGRYLRRQAFGTILTTADVEAILEDLVEALQVAGLLQPVRDYTSRDGTQTGYQIPAAALRWKPGTGEQAPRDVIRIPRGGTEARVANRFFADFYRTIARELAHLESREHTAQVSAAEREVREELFRKGALPVLFCSPTMELGIDIARLNVVGMRNVPPTPANYAQRSGRAGRSGQPAFVITYCSTGSAHDQYFFRRPQLMVAGKVQPPRLDLGNEELVRSHVHAIWLAESGLSLRRSLADVLDVQGASPSLALQPRVTEAFGNRAARMRTRERAKRMLDSIEDELAATPWWTPDWLAETLDALPQRFDEACQRWRELYRAAQAQRTTQHAVIGDSSRSAQDREQAERLRAEAEAQIRLLLNERTVDFQSDFYSYRYFASEGFLPGYNFPRLPLSAWIPARRAKSVEQYLTRPRFIAIREFGPQAAIYHEGSIYRVHRVILPIEGDGEPDREQLVTSSAVHCEACGYLHPAPGGTGPDRCEHCGADLARSRWRYRSLLRLSGVSTKRSSRISANDEERRRRGFELRTSFRWAERHGRPNVRTAQVVSADGEELAHLSYGPAATLQLINVGWHHRRDREELGFLLDLERGYWERRQDENSATEDDPRSGRTVRVIPYVEDRRNALVVEPCTHSRDEAFMASLEAALKAAIQARYNLEDDELAVVSLPARADRRSILLYEAAEGGAGVLRHVVEDPAAFVLVARQALELCHYDPDTLVDRRRAPGAREDCEAACYDCLLSYYNQPDHGLVDRALIAQYLAELAAARVDTSPTNLSRDEHLERLLRLTQSDLERDWLQFLAAGGYRLPDRAQVLIEEAGTRPDFVYDADHLAIYVDGPHHRYPERHRRDLDAEERLFVLGWSVVRFRASDDWQSIVARHPRIFGRGGQ